MHCDIIYVYRLTHERRQRGPWTQRGTTIVGGGIVDGNEGGRMHIYVKNWLTASLMSSAQPHCFFSTAEHILRIFIPQMVMLITTPFLGISEDSTLSL